MPRGYWRVILAIVGVALAASLLSVGYSLYNSGQQQHPSYAYQPASKPLLGASTVTPGPAKPYQPYCQNPEDREDADLCAQWAAVDQVAESNRLASVNTRLSIFTLLVTVFGTLLLIWTFDETRETSRRELRAYVHLKCADLTLCGDEFPMIFKHPQQRFADVTFKNYGSTPAHNVEMVTGTKIAPFPLTEPLPPVPDMIERVLSDLPQGRDAPMPLEVFNSGNMHETLMQGGWGVYYWGTVKYEDIFGRKHQTHIQLVSEGLGYRRGMFRPIGDEANKSD